jgi:hypothetical protein
MTSSKSRFSVSALLLLAAVAVAPVCISPRAKADSVPGPEVSSLRRVRAVIELYTSQGCSSCPPADELLKSYSEEEGVIALTLPVDYWDYIGWKDTLASPKNTERQRAYAKSLGSGSVYTPQAVINGVTHAVGSNRSDVEKNIEKTETAFARRRVPMRFTRDGGRFLVQTGSAPDGSAIGEAMIWIAVMTKAVPVAIKRGENSGKTVTYTNVVREMVPVGTWNGTPGAKQIALSARIDPEADDVVAILQEGPTGTGAIVGAAWLNR